VFGPMHGVMVYILASDGIQTSSWCSLIGVSCSAFMLRWLRESLAGGSSLPSRSGEFIALQLVLIACLSTSLVLSSLWVILVVRCTRLWALSMLEIHHRYLPQGESWSRVLVIGSPCRRWGPSLRVLSYMSIEMLADTCGASDYE
jgi:hypothetical protein